MALYHFRFLLLCALCLPGFASFANTGAADSLLRNSRPLPEIQVMADKRQPFSGLITTQVFNTSKLVPGSNLADILPSQSLAFVKSYYPGGLNTLSLRGTGAYHTAVLWNGFNIQNPMNGTVDLSLVPINSMNNLSIQYGSECALYGSGAIGGTISLRQIPEFTNDTRASLHFSLGSFGFQQQDLNLSSGTNRIRIQTSYQHQQALNNFTYFEDPAGRRFPKQFEHARYSQHIFNFQASFRIRRFQSLTIGAYYLDASRQLPAVISQANSKATQADKNLRAYAEWQSRKASWQFALRSAFFREQIDYRDPMNQLSSLSTSLSSITEAETHLNIGQLQEVQAGLNLTWQQGRISSYSITNPFMIRSALFASYRIHDRQNRLEGIVSLRQEMIGKKSAPFVFHAVFQGRPIKPLLLSIRGGRIYRNPTLNDLYWNPGGNPDLLPEKGWSLEGGIKQESQWNKWSFRSSVNLYSNWIRNWIIWLPQAQYWSPVNIREVWSRGFELGHSISYQSKKAVFELKGSYQYVKSTNVAAKSAGDESAGKQLIYEPQHKLFVNAMLSLFGVSITYDHNFTGKRFTSSDNEYSLPAFHTGDLMLAYDITHKGFNAKIYAQAFNLWNAQYQIMESRPMPGRSFRVGIKFQLIQSHEKK